MRTTIWRPDTLSDTATQGLPGVPLMLKCHVSASLLFKLGAQSIKATVHLHPHLAVCGPGTASLALETDDK